MAREAFRVIGRCVLIELFVRVVAGDAGEAGVAVGAAPALAVFEAVRLEADVHDAAEFLFSEDDVGPGAVTRAAKIHRCSCIETARIEDGGAALLDFSGLHRGDVSGSGAVAGFALHAGSEMRRVEMAGDAGRSRVAAEAAARFVGVEPAAHRGFEIVGSGGVVAGGEIERLQRFVEAEMAFVEAAVAFVNVGLAFVAEAEGPRDGGGERLRAVGDGEIDGAWRGGELVVKCGALLGEVGVGLQDFGVGGRRGGVRHRSCLLRGGDLRVALRAFGDADEFVERSGGFGRPPTGRSEVVFGGE